MSDLYGVSYAFTLIYQLIVSAFALLIFILVGITTFQLMKRRNLPGAWTSFVPLLNNYAFGAIADHISARSGKKTAYRFSLPIIATVLSISVIAMLITLIAMVFEYMPLDVTYSYLYGYDYPYYGNEEDLIAIGLATMLFLFVIGIVSILYTIFYYIAMYKIFKDYNPSNAVMYTVLSIFISVVQPFLFFSLRKKPSVTMGEVAGYGYTQGYNQQNNGYDYQSQNFNQYVNTNSNGYNQAPPQYQNPQQYNGAQTPQQNSTPVPPQYNQTSNSQMPQYGNQSQTTQVPPSYGHPNGTQNSQQPDNNEQPPTV